MLGFYKHFTPHGVKSFPAARKILGRERTEAEFRELYERAGFRLTRVVPTESPFSVIEGVRV